MCRIIRDFKLSVYPPPLITPDNREYLQGTHNENLQVAHKKGYIFTCTDILPVQQTPLNAVYKNAGF